MHPSPRHTAAALLLSFTLAACGGGGSDGGSAAPPPVPPPVVAPPTQSLTLSGDASEVLAGGKAVTLTATPAVAATIAWSLEGPGALSATSGGSVSYTPPAAGVGANTPVAIKASAGDAAKTWRLTVYPDPGAPRLALIAGTLGSTGNLDGAAADARFTEITDLAADTLGNLYAIDDGRLRKVAANGQVSAVPLPISSLGAVNGVSVAPDNTVYLLLRNVAGERLVVKLLADGSTLPFLPPALTDQSTARIVAGNGKVYMIGNKHVSVADGVASGLLAGAEEADTYPCRDGSGADARLGVINDAALDAGGNLLLQSCFSVRKIAPAGVVSTLAGGLERQAAPTDGSGAAAQFGDAAGSIAADRNGNIRELDFAQKYHEGAAGLSYRLRKVDAGGVVSTLRRGEATPYQLRTDGSYGRPSPYKLVRYLADGTTIVATSAQLWKADAGGALSAYAGNEGDVVAEIAGTTATARFVNPRSLSADTVGNLYVLDDVDAALATAYKIAPDGTVTQIMRRGDFNQPSQIIVAPDGAIYLTKKARPFPYPDHWQYRGDTIYKLDAAGVPQLLAGSGLALLGGTPRVDGAGAAATFYSADPLGFDGDGNLYVQDAELYRKVTPQGVVTTVAAPPAGVGVAPDGYRYVVDSLAGLVYRVAADGGKTVVAGAEGRDGNRIGALPGSLKATPAGSGAPASLAMTPTGPGSFALISGGAILKLVVPH
jgi:hypothetical protein